MISFDIPIYGGKVLVFNDKEEYKERYEDLEGEDPEIDNLLGSMNEATDDEEHMIYFIGVFDKDEDTLLHEITHLAVAVAEYRAWEICEKTTEPFAYLLEFLFKHARLILK